MTERSVRLRRLRAPDAPAVAALEKQVFPAEAWSENLVEEELSSPWGHYVGAFDGNRLVGYGGVKGHFEGDLMTLGVAPECRGQGLGRRILEDLCSLAWNAGMNELVLEVRASNDIALGLYRSVGFEVCGRIPGYYRDPGEDALVMKLLAARR